MVSRIGFGYPLTLTLALALTLALTLTVALPLALPLALPSRNLNPSPGQVVPNLISNTVLRIDDDGLGARLQQAGPLTPDPLPLPSP